MTPSSEGRDSGGSASISQSNHEENGEVSRAMNDANYLDRLRLPYVGHHIGVEVPEAILPAEEFFKVVADAGRSAQLLKSFVEFRP